MKILIVEDEQGLNDNIHSYFEEDVNICEVSNDLSGAINKLSLHDYYIALLYIGLPDGEGFEVLNFLKTRMTNEAVLMI